MMDTVYTRDNSTEMNNDMNFTRQEELYDGNNNNDRVNIIGVGATGSWVALALAKLGVHSVTMYDGDIIELHNVPNQLYSKRDVGKLKSVLCKKYCDDLGSGKSQLIPFRSNVDVEDMGDLIHNSVATFCLVDSMKARKELVEAAIDALAPGQHHYWIETRMGLTGYRVYLIDLANEYQVAEYKKTLYNDEDAGASACGYSQSIVTTAMQCAGHAVGLWLAKMNNAEYVPNEIIFDVHSTFILHKKFEPKE